MRWSSSARVASTAFLSAAAGANRTGADILEAASLVLAFASSLILGFIGFLAMLACAFFFERNLRVMGRAGWQQVTGNLRPGNLKDSVGDVGRKLRKRFKNEES